MIENGVLKLNVAILCEKRSAFDNFATAFGGERGICEGHEYTLVHAKGHIFGYLYPDKQVAPEKQDKYKSWNLENLPWELSDISWKRGLKKDSQVKTQLLPKIKTAFQNADAIVIGTDIDPSGEGFLIAWEIIEELKLTKKPLYRMVFVDERPESLRRAFKTMERIDNPYLYGEFLKSDARSKFDWLSMQYSRMVTKIGNFAVASGSKNVDYVARVGRLKSFVVNCIGEQIEAYENYKKVPFYDCRFKDSLGHVYTNPDNKAYKERNLVPLPSFKESETRLVSRVSRRKSPDKLLDLSTLGGILSKEGISSEQVLVIADELYGKNILSYPRTEDKNITTGQFNEMLPFVDKIADCVGVDKALLTHRTPRKTHVIDKGSHGANRPGVVVPKSLAEIERSYSKAHARVYEVLAKSFLAMFAEDYQYDELVFELVMDSDYKCKKKIPTNIGYQRIFTSEDVEEIDTRMCEKVAKVYIHEGFPKRPEKPSLIWLMKNLEKHDVGTGATRLSTYSEMVDNKGGTAILKQSRNKIELTGVGWLSYYLCKDTQIASMDLTKRIQDELKKIEVGELDKTEFLERFKHFVLADMIVVKNNREMAKVKILERKYGIIDKNSDTGGNNMSFVQKEKATITFVDGTERTFNRQFADYKFTDEDVEVLAQGGDITFTFTGKDGKTKRKVKGNLQEYEFNGRQNFGFQVTEWLTDGNK